MDIKRVRRPLMALLLDALIGAYTLVLGIVFLAGGIDVQGLSATRPAKPLLMLMLLVSLRLAVSGAWPMSWMVPLVSRPSGLGPALFMSRVRLPTAIRDVLFAFVLARLTTVGITFLSNLFFPAARARLERKEEYPWFAPASLAEVFAAWDSRWYFGIAQHGYAFNADAQSNVAFFPLYPLLMRAVAWPVGGSDHAIWIAGVVISWAAFAAALMVLHRFTERYTGDPETARRTILYLAVFPFSFFFAVVYTESLFLLLTVLAVAAAYDARWTQAGVWGGLAALTRPNGVLIAVPLVCFALAGRPSFRECVRRVPSVVLPVMGLGLFCFYLWRLTGDPLAWLAAQQHWAYTLGHAPGEQLLKLISRVEYYGLYGAFVITPNAPIELVQGGTALLFLMLTPHVFTRIGVPLGAYVLVSLLVPLSSNEFEGLGRYAAVLFPVFMLLARVRSPWAHESVLIASALFLALFASLFVARYPMY